MNKLMEKIGGVLDRVTLFFLAVYAMRSLMSGDSLQAVMILGVLGIWCISCTLVEIKTMLEEKSKNG